MEEKKPLSQEQLDRIAATLKRIRDGLGRFLISTPDEPAHTFTPEAFDEQES